MNFAVLSGRGAFYRVDAELHQPLLHFVARHRGIGLAVEPVDDGARRALRGEQHDAGIGLPFRHAGFGRGRDLRGERGALRRGRRDCAHAARLDVRRDRRRAAQHECQPPAEHVVDRGGLAPIGHMIGLHARQRLEQLRTEMHRAPASGRAVVRLVGIRLQIGDERRQVVDRQRGMRHQNEVDDAHQGDRLEVRDRIVRQLLLQRDVDRMRERRDQQRVAVGVGLGDRIGSDDHAGTGRLSITIGWPSPFAIRSATTRAPTSVAPPAR